MKYRTTPLIPEMKENFDNSTKYMETNAAAGWIRGGVPSRELTRDRGGDNVKN
jgi:hypothetical protein